MKKLIFSIVVIIFSTLSYLQAQDSFERQRQRFNQEFEKNKTSFTQKLEKSKANFDRYIAEQQSNFAQFVEKSWKEFDAYSGKKSLIDNKPVKQPVFKPKSKPQLKPKPKKPIATPKPKPPKIFNPNNQIISSNSSKVVVDFFGEKLAFTQINNPIKIKTQDKISNKQIRQYLDTTNTYEKLLKQELVKYTKNLNLDDWATYQLVKQFAQVIYTDSKHQNLAVWKWLNFLGFDARMGISNNKFILLLPVNRQIYSVSYVTINQQKFYNFSKNKISRLSTYEQTLKNKKVLSYFEPALTQWKQNSKFTQSRLIQFKYNNKQHKIDIDYDLRSFYLAQSYPQFDLKFYFSRKVSALMSVSLKQNILPLLKNLTQLEKAQSLLTMVQDGFEYQTDKDQFGKENYLLPIESIGHPYTDCEDRSILYAWLVKNLVGLDYVAVVFPNHLTTAIDINTKGNTINYKGSNYVIADPTYIGANIGQSIHKKNGKVIYVSS